VRQIKKTHPPQIYSDWLKLNKGTTAYCYDGLTSVAKTALQVQLIEEQFFLCAYTGRRITTKNSHLEHLKPQNLCATGEDVSYRNLVACFPLNAGNVTLGYGAPFKAGWWDASKFVSPLMKDCERHFQFAWNGKVKEFPKDDASALETIKRLGLDHKDLVSARLDKIKGFFGFGHNMTPISEAEAAQLKKRINQPNSSGELLEFCFVFEQLLRKYKTP
jgi:uncharacterized protein (TIGR02646 family)